MKKLFYTKKGNLILIGSVFAAVLLGILAVGVFKFELVGLLPPCPFNSLFGIRCAGCGATRSLSSLFHGKFWAAIYFNPLFVIALFIFLLCFIKFIFKALKQNYTPPTYKLSNIKIIAIAVIIVCFIVVRNFDFYKAIFY